MLRWVFTVMQEPAMSQQSTFQDLSSVTAQYQDAYRQYGREDLRSIFSPKGRHLERFTTLSSSIQKDGFSILDYGCGLGHLYPFLQQRFQNFQYTGVDIVPEFVRDNQAIYPDAKFQLIQGYPEVAGRYDYVFSSQVFNLMYFDNIQQQKQLIFETLTHLFEKTNSAMAIDFMPADVDFMQEGAYHQDVMEIYQFVRNKLTRRLSINQSHLPFEFTVIAYKDDEILKPSNSYRDLV
jgi:SAM-dependent methyltransferase